MFLFIQLEISRLLKMLAVTFSQFSALLDCATESKSLDQGLPVMKNGCLGCITKDSDIWKDIKNCVKLFNISIQQIQASVEEKISDAIVCWGQIKTFSEQYSTIQSNLDSLMEIIPDCANDMLDFKYLKKMVNDLHSSALEKEAQIKNSHSLPETCELLEVSEGNAKEPNSRFPKLCQNLAIQILLAFQEMLAFSSLIKDQVEFHSLTNDESLGNFELDNLFTVKVVESLQKTRCSLRVDKILKIIEKLKMQISTLQNSAESLQSNDTNFRYV